MFSDHLRRVVYLFPYGPEHETLSSGADDEGVSHSTLFEFLLKMSKQVVSPRLETHLILITLSFILRCNEIVC